MKTNDISLIVCPVCGQINVCGSSSGVCICPVCQNSTDHIDEITVELIV